jgi:hypothetical protein
MTNAPSAAATPKASAGVAFGGIYLPETKPGMDMLLSNTKSSWMFQDLAKLLDVPGLAKPLSLLHRQFLGSRDVFARDS